MAPILASTGHPRLITLARNQRLANTSRRKITHIGVAKGWLWQAVAAIEPTTAVTPTIMNIESDWLEAVESACGFLDDTIVVAIIIAGSTALAHAEQTSFSS